MNDLTQTLKDLPWSGFIPLSLLVISGFLIWAAGRRILKVGFALIGAVAGLCAGLLLGDSASFGAPSWVVALVCAAVLASVAVIAHRFAVSLAMMALIAIASPLAVISAVELQARNAGMTVSDGEVHNPLTDEITQWIDDHDNPASRAATQAATQSVVDSLSRAKDALAQRLGTEEDQIRQLEEYGQRLSDLAKEQWDKTPQKMRPTLILASVIGGLVGLLLGIIAPSFSAGAVTALGGSLLWLTGLRIFALRLGVPDGPWLPSSGVGWLCVWLITAALGVGIQWTVEHRRADKPGDEL